MRYHMAKHPAVGADAEKEHPAFISGPHQILRCTLSAPQEAGHPDLGVFGVEDKLRVGSLRQPLFIEPEEVHLCLSAVPD